MKEQKRVAILVNTIGAAGYFCLLLVWLLFVGVVVLFVTEQRVPVEAISRPGELPGFISPNFMSGAVEPIGIGVTAILVLLTTAIVVLFPYFVGKFGSRMLKGVLTFLEVQLTRRALFAAKIGALVLPVAGFLLLSLIFKPNDEMLRAVTLASQIVAAASALLFGTQLLLAWRLKIDTSRLW